MTTTTINFERIGTIDDFYKLLKQELPLPEYFGDNLDALWDVLTGDIDLPAQIQFTNMTLNQLEQFDKLIMVFEDAAAELGEDFIFEYYLNVNQ